MTSETPNTAFIAALDVGTTTVRCYIFDQDTKIVGAANCQTRLLYPKQEYVEIDPEELWNSVVEVLKGAINDAKLEPSQIQSLGISTLRATFITWRKSNGKHFHNFITWKDMRASNLVKELNRTVTLMGFRLGAYSMHMLTGSKRMLTGSKFHFANNHTSVKLAWVLSNIPELKSAMQEKDVLFGTVDTWLLHKFTSGKLHVTDISNASGTGMFDPYVNKWGGLIKYFTNIPFEILPEIVPNDYDYGTMVSSILGIALPIKCTMADQSAALFGSCCFHKSDLKVTLGTGSFLSVNTGNTVEAGIDGLNPLVSWCIKDQVVYNLEAASNDTGSLIEWALNAGLVANAAETSTLALESCHNDGVYFIPAFSGLGHPLNNENAASGFLGLKPTTQKTHMVRAILESIIYRVVLSYEMLKNHTNIDFKQIRVDGGVSKNDFVCQHLADMTGIEVERANSTEMTGLGVALVCGLTTGVWKNEQDIRKHRKIDRIFRPTADENLLKHQKRELDSWLKAAERFKSWYRHT